MHDDVGRLDHPLVEKWQVTSRGPEQDFHIFRAQWRRTRSPRTGEEHDVIVLSPPNWVNVVAVTPDEQVVLIHQYRHGVQQVLLEVPGGMLDADESPIRAGARELLEETGYAGDEPVLIGTVHPNPAFLSNICSSVLIRNVRKVANPQLDDGEDIEVTLAPIAEVPALIRSGRITHALVIVAFYHAGVC